MRPVASLSSCAPFAIDGALALKVAIMGRGRYLLPVSFLGPKTNLTGFSLHFCLMMKTNPYN
jgi:hypothetical protein